MVHTRGDGANRFEILRGLGHLVFDAVEGSVSIVEAMHATIAAAPMPLGTGRTKARGVTGLVYRTVGLVNGAVRFGVDPLLGLFDYGAGEPEGRWDVFRSVINGVLGDHLASSGNPLALPTEFRHEGRRLTLESALAADLPLATGKVLVLVHGLCMNDCLWKRRGHDHGEELARDLGYTAISVRYNSGRHISQNGRELSGLLETLLRRWPKPVEELTILAHSMGGLVSRSAHHYGRQAGHEWPRRLRNLVFLGTPHHGAPLERVGNRFQALVGVSPYTAPLSRLGMIRSAGVTDLRYGSILEEDWHGRERFADGGDCRASVPLPEGVSCFAIAGSLGERAGDLRDRLFGDGLVPVRSALGRHPRAEKSLAFPESRLWVAYGAGHLDLLARREVYAKVRDWLVAT